MKIQSQLGAGGMGEVYSARDTRLERDVAIKVLRDNLSSDPPYERLPDSGPKVDGLGPNTAHIDDTATRKLLDDIARLT